MSTQTRVFAITGKDAPASSTRVATLGSAGDTAYLVGPYRELLATLRKGQSGWQPDSGEVVTSREQEHRGAALRRGG